MKKYSLLIAVIIMCSACSNENKPSYLSAISNYVQTDKSGSKHDLKFQPLEWKEMKEITVNDSINLLKEEFENSQKPFIKQLELAKDMNTKLLSDEKNRRNPRKEDIDRYEEREKSINQQIDSVKNLPPTNLSLYENEDKSRVIAKVIRCTYSAVNPFTNTAVEETYDFTISPDGNKVYEAIKVKNNPY